MRRWTTLAIVAAMTACQGGAHEMGEGSIQRSRAQTQHNAPPVRIARAQPTAPRSEAPTLINVAGRGVATEATPAVVAPAMPTASAVAPPSGGYIVRSTTAHPTPTYAPAPPPVTVARSEPRSVDEESPSAGGSFRVRRTATRATVAPAHEVAAAPARGHGHASGNIGAMGHGGGGAGYGRGDASGGASLDGALSASVGMGPTTGATISAPPPAPPPATAAPSPTMVAPPPGGSTHVTIAVTTTPTVVAPVADQQYVEPAGILTAASVGDTDRRGNYLEYLARHGEEASDLALDMTRRVRFRVVDAQGRPVNDARVSIAGDGAQFVGRTHADGSWDFFPSVVAPQFAGNVTARADVENVGTQAVVNVPAQGDAQGPIVLQIPAVIAPPPPALDLGFVIDVTGSMGDELSYVNREIGNIVQRIEAQAPGTRVRVSATFYRDRVDSLIVQQIPFTDNVPGFASVMQGVSASGGGDYPEDMNAGLEAAMTRLSWSEGPASRVMVLIADAPPQPYQDEAFTYRNAMLDASRRGIRILPVAASGADRSVEYLFRAMGAMTSTPYVYLTDDSGVGAPHMEADTDRVAVERFNDLLVRMVLSDLHGEGMHEPGPLAHEG